MIVLNKQHRVFGVCHLFEYGFSEFLVDIPIVLPITRTKQWPGMGYMAERPQTFVGKAVIVSLFLLLGEPYATQSVFRFVGRNAQPVMLVHGFAISVAASMRYPGAITCAQDRRKRRDQSAGGNQHAQRLAFLGVHIWFTV